MIAFTRTMLDLAWLCKISHKWAYAHYLQLMILRVAENRGLPWQPRIVCVRPKLLHLGTHAFKHRAVRGIGREIVHFRWILPQIVELLRRAMQKRLHRAGAESD